MAGDDKEVSVRFGAQTDGFAAGIQRATAEMRRTQLAFRESKEDALVLDNALAKYLARLDPTYKAQKLLADGLVLLDRNLAAGNISAATHAQAVAKIEAAYGAASRGVVESSGRISFATAGVSRELIVLGHEAVSGNWTRMPGSMMVLAERVGGLHHIFAALASPVGLVTMAIGGTVAVIAMLTAQAVHANLEMTKLQTTMEGTGRAGIVSEANMRAYVTQLARLPGINREAAESIVEQFSRSRQIGGVLFDQLIRIVGDFAYVTGHKAPDAAKELAKAFSDPVRGAKELDAQLGILSASQLRQIETLARQGDTMRAQQVLFEALKDRIQGLSDKQLSFAKIIDVVRENWAKFMLIIADPSMLQQAGTAIDVLIQKMRGLYKGESEVRMKVTGKPIEASGKSDADTVKDALAATQNVISLNERRKALQDEILRLQNAQKVATGEEAAILQGRTLEAQKQLADLKGKGDMSRVQAYRVELEQMKAAENGFLDFSKQREIDFWQSKLAQVRKGGTDYAAIEQELYTARKAKAKEDLDTQVAEIKANAARFKEGSQERVQAAQEAARIIGQAYGMESSHFKAAQREVEAAQRARIQQQRQMDEQLIDSQVQHAKISNDIERDRLAFEVSMGTMTAQERIAALRQLEQREYQMERQALSDKLALQGVEAPERQKLNSQIEQLESTHMRRMVKLNQDSALESQKRWTDFWKPVGTAFESGISAMLMRTQTLRQGMLNITQAILGSFIGMVGKMVAEWAAGTAAMAAIKGALGVGTAASEGAVSPQAIAETANTAAVVANTTAQGTATGALAGNAYATSSNTAATATNTGALAALTDAVIANTGAQGGASGGSLLGSVMKFVPGFAVGAWDLPSDTLAKVHKGEMIIPAQAAEGARKMFSTGGWTVPRDLVANAATSSDIVSMSLSTKMVASASNMSNGGDTHNNVYNISAVDGDSVRRFFRNHRGAMSGQIKTSVRDHGLRMPK